MKKNFSYSLAAAALLTLTGCTTIDQTPETKKVVPPIASPSATTVQTPQAPTPAEQQTPTPTSTPVSATPSPTAVVETSPPTDTPTQKTYTFESPYITPKGMTDLNVSFSVVDNTVKSFSLTGNPAHDTSIKKQALFFEGAKEYVIGKSLDELKALPAVLNGSSLTSAGFNAALEQLKAEG